MVNYIFVYGNKGKLTSIVEYWSEGNILDQDTEYQPNDMYNSNQKVLNTFNTWNWVSI